LGFSPFNKIAINTNGFSQKKIFSAKANSKSIIISLQLKLVQLIAGDN
jgi:hypothetical protein